MADLSMPAPKRGTTPARRLIAAGIIRRFADRTLTMRVTEAGVTGRITPVPARVTNYDCLGSVWGHDTIADAEAGIAERRAAGASVEEWTATDRDGNPLRIVRTTEPDTSFLGGIDICAFTGTTPARAQTIDDDSDDVCPICEQWVCRCGTGRTAVREAVAAR